MLYLLITCTKHLTPSKFCQMGKPMQECYDIYIIFILLHYFVIILHKQKHSLQSNNSLHMLSQ